MKKKYMIIFSSKILRKNINKKWRDYCISFLWIPIKVVNFFLTCFSKLLFMNLMRNSRFFGFFSFKLSLLSVIIADVCYIFEKHTYIAQFGKSGTLLCNGNICDSCYNFVQYFDQPTVTYAFVQWEYLQFLLKFCAIFQPNGH